MSADSPAGTKGEDLPRRVKRVDLAEPDRGNRGDRLADRIEQAESEYDVANAASGHHCQHAVRGLQGSPPPARRDDSSPVTKYRMRVSSSLSPEEIRAAAETHNDLGPAYRDAVIESFLDKVGREIDARVNARLVQQQAAQPSARDRRGHSGSPMALAIISMALGIPISGIAVAAGAHPAGFMGLLVVWIAITAINIAYNISYAARSRQPPDRR